MPDQAAALAAATAELGELHGDDIEAEVADWPDLTEQQRAELSVILHGGGDDATT